MDSVLRLLPYLWPYRRWLAASLGTAVCAAAVWAISLSLSYPIVKVLLEGQSFHEFVGAELERARQEVLHEEQQQQETAPRLSQLRAAGRQHSSEYLELVRDEARSRSYATDAARRVAFFSRLDAWILPHLPRDPFNVLAVIFGVLLATTICHGLLVMLQEICIGTATELALQRLRARLLRRTLQLDFPTLAAHGSSDLLGRFQNDLQQVRDGLQLLGSKVMLEPLKITACLSGAWIANWRLTLLTLLCVPIGGWVLQRFGKQLKQANRRQMERAAGLIGRVTETVHSFRIMQASGAEHATRQKYAAANRDYRSQSMAIRRREAMGGPMTEFLAMIAVFVALLPGAYLVLRHREGLWGVRLAGAQMDVAQLALLYTLLGGVMDPVRKMSGVYSKLRRTSAACDRLFGLMDLQPKITSPASPVAAARHHASIAFHDLTCSYPARDNQDRRIVLDDISLTIQHGDIVAIVGPNGSGKSTLVSLLPRLMDPDHGQVQIDGVDTRKLDLVALRSQIGIVSQETLLFDRTIAENIAYGTPGATRFQIEQAAQQAHVLAFARQMPEGLETRVGVRGQRLSGGQRQRVALARALLRNPEILILDEATSAVDAQSEGLIYETLERMLPGRTTLLVTHALSPALLKLVTRIVVLAEGRIVGDGQHAQLLANCDTYRTLFSAQSRNRAA